MEEIKIHKDSEDFIKTLNVCGTEVGLFNDDYGQCYYIEWVEDGELREMGLGTYNFFYMESIYSLLDPVFKDLLRKELFGEPTEEEHKKYLEYQKMFDEEEKS